MRMIILIIINSKRKEKKKKKTKKRKIRLSFSLYSNGKTGKAGECCLKRTFANSPLKIRSSFTSSPMRITPPTTLTGKLKNSWNRYRIYLQALQKGADKERREAQRQIGLLLQAYQGWNC